MKSRTKLFLPLLFLSLLVDGGSASAANLAGSKCTKPGQIKTVSKITYVCAKVGKSSVWIQAGNSGKLQNLLQLRAQNQLLRTAQQELEQNSHHN